MEISRPIKKTSESRVVKTQRVFPDDLNNNHTVFGGCVLSLMDMTASISVARHTRKTSVTASMDSVNFIYPANLDDSICAECFVSGVGNSSVEIFCKVIVENLITGERKLCATSFITFTCYEEDGTKAIVPLIEPETKEEIYIHGKYKQRREERLKNRFSCSNLNKNISLDIPWVTKNN